MLYRQADITVDSIFDFKLIKEIKLTGEVNQHTNMVICGIFESETGHKVLQSQLKRERIHIKTTDGTIVFAGLPFNVCVKEQARLFIIVLTCIGSSYLLDTKLQKRSFQHRRDTYADILRFAYSKAEQGTIFTPKGNDVQIRTPIFQYNETDWKFTHRMAEHLETVIVPNDQSASPQVSIGIPNRRPISIPLEDIEYTAGRNERNSLYYTLHTKEHMFLEIQFTFSI